MEFFLFSLLLSHFVFLAEAYLIIFFASFNNSVLFSEMKSSSVSSMVVLLVGGGSLLMLMGTRRKIKRRKRDQNRKTLLDSRVKHENKSFSPCFRLENFLSNPMRFSKQIFQLLNAYLFCSWTKPEVIVALTNKVSRATKITSDVVVQCQCGKCQVVAHNGGGHSTVCHCSVCRFHNGGTANPWKAVNRHSCFITGSEDANVAWTDSSFFSRRARCVHCDSVLMMDYEYFEPNTVWLGNPSIVIRDDKTQAILESVPIQEYEEGGLVDADVCWNSRDVPVPKDGMLSDFGGFFKENKSAETCTVSATQQKRRSDENVEPLLQGSGAQEKNISKATEYAYQPQRGKAQWEDIDWRGYLIDSGKL